MYAVGLYILFVCIHFVRSHHLYLWYVGWVTYTCICLMSMLHTEHTLFFPSHIFVTNFEEILVYAIHVVSFNILRYREDCMGICSFDSNCRVFSNNVHILGSWEGSWFQFLGSYSVHNSGSYHRVPNYPGTCTCEWYRVLLYIGFRMLCLTFFKYVFDVISTAIFSLWANRDYDIWRGCIDSV